MRNERPNVLLLLTDNQRDDQLRCAGHRILQTPNLDRLATSGVRFVNALATSPICAASRASILTGLHESTHRFTFFTPPLPTEFTDISYPALLKAAGYRTGLIGKFGIASSGTEPSLEDERALSKMFDVFDNYEHPVPDGYFQRQPDGSMRHLTDVTSDKALDFLDLCPSNRPWCLSVNFNAPHAQDDDPRLYIWPPSADGLYENAVVPEPVNADPEFFEALPDFLKQAEGRRRWRYKFSTSELYQRSMKGKYRMITGVDTASSIILAKIEELGMRENTVVIFSSDHGMFFGDRGLADCWLMHEECLRVLLIVCDPRLGTARRGILREEMALIVDIAPTILELAGVEPPARMQGQSLLPLLRGEWPEWRTECFIEHRFDRPGFPKSEGVRTTCWKYFRYYEQDPVHEELYDLENDPHEANNLAGDPAVAAQLDRHRARCDEWKARLQSS